MNKQQLLQSCWTPVERGLPPPIRQEIIILVNDCIIVRDSCIARTDAERFLHDKHPAAWAWDRIYSHWMFIPLPEKRA